MAASPSQPYRVDWRNRPTDFDTLNQGLSGIFDHADQMFQELYGRVARLAAASSSSGTIGVRGSIGPPGFDGQDGEDGFLGYGRSPYGSLQALANGGTGTTTIFTVGSVVFAGVGGVYTQDNAHLFWDDTNDRLGVGTTAPASDFHVSRDSTGFSATVPAVKAIVQNLSTEVAANVGAVLDVKNSVNLIEISMHGTGQTGTRMGLNFANLAEIVSAGASALSILTNDASAPIHFGCGAPAAPHVTFDTTGFVGIGTKVPGFALEIKKASAAIAINDTTTSVPVIYLQDNGSTVFSFQGLSGDAYFTGIVGHDSIFRPDGTERVRFKSGGNVGIGQTSPSAVLHLKAGTATANTAPIKLTSGTVLTSPEAGTIEFTTDDFFATITTGPARKAFILDNGSRLTSGKMPIATTNGRLVDLTASSAYTPTNVSTDRAYDANATTLDELADVVGTIIADLQTKGILG